MMRPGVTCLLALGFALLGGCTNVVDGSKEEFSRSYTCPIDRIEAHARPDLRPSDLDPRKPPRDIAADPDRLKMWEADRKRATEYEDSRDSLVELRGCGHQVLYACHRFKNGNKFMCSSKEYPPGVKAAW
jgi:hypothetical protein